MRQGARATAHICMPTSAPERRNHTLYDVSVAQVMPIAKATLYTIKAVNGLAGIAQCFLPGTAAGQKEEDLRGRGEACPCDAQRIL